MRTTTRKQTGRPTRRTRAGLAGAATLAVLASAVAAAAPASAAARPLSETGDRCTIVGTQGKDVLRGTSGRDVICGLGGNDTIKGLGGNDVIDGGAGSDKIDGGTGHDVLLGGAGKDSISGGSGSDQVEGGSSKDSLTGGSGSDVLLGGSSGDVLKGGSGNDGLIGNSGKDRYVGSSGADTCTFESREDASRSSCVGDHAAPQVTGITLDRTTVDSRSGDGKVTVSARARDDMAAYVDVTLVGSGDLGTMEFTADSGGYWGRPTSGSAKDGTWDKTFTIPHGTPSGSFDVVVTAWDSVHQTPTTKVYRGAVTHKGASYTQPKVTGFTASNGPVIDVRNGSQKVTYSATIADPQQRMDTYADLSMVSTTGMTSADLDGYLSRTGGTPANGTWTTSRTISKGSPTDTYDWVLRTTSKEGRTTTWVGPTLWESTYKGQPGYALLPGAQTFQVLGTASANQSLPQLNAASVPGTVTVGSERTPVPWTVEVSDRDPDSNLRATVYLKSADQPDVWFEGTATGSMIIGEDDQQRVTGYTWLPTTTPRGQYEVWILVSDQGTSYPGNHVWFGPAGGQAPTGVKTPGTVTVKELTRPVSPMGATITVR